jgi:hypothetical protein
MYVTLIHHNEVDKRHEVILTFASKVNCAEDMARRGVENMIMRTCRRAESNEESEKPAAEITFSAEMMNIQHVYTQDQLICERSVNLYTQHGQINFLFLLTQLLLCFLFSLSLLHIFIIRSPVYVYTSFITYPLIRPPYNKSKS